MSVKRASIELVTALRKGWEYPHVKKMKAQEVDLALTTVVESVSDNLGTIKRLPIKEKKQVLSLLIKAKELYTPKRGTEVERRVEEAPAQETRVEESCFTSTVFVSVYYIHDSLCDIHPLMRLQNANRL